MARRLIPVASLVALFAAAGCSDDSRRELRADAEDVLDDATETAVRNFAALQGAEHFNAAGHELDDDGLACTAEVGEGGLDAVDIECTGTTADGGDAVLRGTTAELPGASITELKGSYTATVDGDIAFETEQLGG